jgi:hypothetical protein
MCGIEGKQCCCISFWIGLTVQYYHNSRAKVLWVVSLTDHVRRDAHVIKSRRM